MPDLHTVIEPVWKAWPELKPEGLQWRLDQWHCFRGGRCSFWIDTVGATALCIAAMVEWLIVNQAVPEFDGDADDTGLFRCSVEFTDNPNAIVDPCKVEAPTLVEALAAACIALAEAKEVSYETG